MLASAKTQFGSKTQTKDVFLRVCLWIVRVLIIISCAVIFFPAFNPARISNRINKSLSLFTTGISYDDLTKRFLRGFDNGWLNEGTIILLMISSIIIIIGVALAGAGGCMSLGNTRMKKFGFWFPIAGSLTMFLGLGGILLSYNMLLKSPRVDFVEPLFPKNNYIFFAALSALILIFSVVIKALLSKKESEDRMNIQEKYSLFLYFLPIIFFTFVFSYLPLWGWRYSFYYYRPGEDLTEFVGFKWFKFFVQNSAYQKELLLVLRNTLIMSGLGIATSWLPILFAIFLNEIKQVRFKKVVRHLLPFLILLAGFWFTR
jgi:putative aldouronate transport system permease protein